MRFKIPGRTTNRRLFERVETTDPQYDIFDVGIEYDNGSIDSLVIPGSGSYSSAKAFVKSIDEKAQSEKSIATT
ncbi:hypothetical protein SynA18461_00197 [Synechococcus sp. A18-46.1]|nr:hypothetical protein SynA18461_00197 [Synechococcus sp. A18-46.1]